TAEQSPTFGGTIASVGAIKLRGLAVEPPSGATTYYPVGSAVAVRLVIVNTGSKPDRLTSITSPAVRDWGAFATTADASAVASADTSPTTSPSTSSSATASASASGTSTSGSASGAPTSSASASSSTAV